MDITHTSLFRQQEPRFILGSVGLANSSHELSSEDLPDESPSNLESNHPTIRMDSSSPNSIGRKLADASLEEDPPNLSFIACVRQLSVDSLLEFARPFLSPTETREPRQCPELSTSPFGVIENYYDAIERKWDHSPLEEQSRVELERATDVLKEQILTMSPDEDNTKRTFMVQQLILLRLKLQELDDSSLSQDKSQVLHSMGHSFARFTIFRHMSKRGKHCEVCGQLMFFAPSQFSCSHCGFSCHERCVSSISRVCVVESIREKHEYTMDICPEKGLDVQNFACAECKKAFPMDNHNVWDTHIRLCDYSGRYYCTICHRNDLDVLPARVIKNWDFSPRPVCRASKQILGLLSSRPILDVMDLNKELVIQVEELSCVQELRGRLLILHRMMMDCAEAPQIALLHKLDSSRKHLMTKAYTYSINDLIEVDRGTLVKDLSAFAAELEHHVKNTCPECVKLTYICGICERQNDRMYPFDERAAVCPRCNAVSHKSCSRTSSGCPNCEKLKQTQRS